MQPQKKLPKKQALKRPNCQLRPFHHRINEDRQTNKRYYVCENLIGRIKQSTTWLPSDEDCKKCNGLIAITRLFRKILLDGSLEWFRYAWSRQRY